MRLATTLRPLLRLATPFIDRWGAAAEVEAPGISESTPPGMHIVREGDSIVRIAAQYDLSAYALMVANPQIMPSSAMVPGQRIVLPSMVPGAAPFTQRPKAAAPARSRSHGAPPRSGQLAAV